MSAEHIAWIVCSIILAVAYGCAIYALVVANHEAREMRKEDENILHPHGHLPSDYDYRREG